MFGNGRIDRGGYRRGERLVSDPKVPQLLQLKRFRGCSAIPSGVCTSSGVADTMRPKSLDRELR
jgi:hypothetical protein